MPRPHGLGVEAARLATRRQRDLIDRDREAMADTLDGAPLAAELPPGGDDARPEAARREVLALDPALRPRRPTRRGGGLGGGPQAAEARAELDRLGDPADLRPALEAARERLPD